jgi:diguanylate cyclase (GGDEF)-like protein
VHNTGGRALDMTGTLRLSRGPGGLSAGPFDATLGTTLAIGHTEPVTITLDKRLPAGPWDARITLRSGLIERDARATLTFPASGASPPVHTRSTGPSWPYVALATLIAGLLPIGLLLIELRRRKRHETREARRADMSPINRQKASRPRQGQPARVTSLRSRWNRAFALLTIMVLLSGLAGLLGTRLLVGNFRDFAVRGENEATTSARLRAEVVAHSILVTSPITAAQQRALTASQSTIQDDFTKAIASEDTPGARKLLRNSLTEWQVIVAAAGTPGHPADLVTRGGAVTTGAPKVLALLDRVGSANRAAVRSELANAAHNERDTMAVLALLELLAIVLAVRLARRLSTEVLRPVGILRDSANHLAAGELDHRVVVDRGDELGELAVSFNAMADAIAGSQRSLTLEANTDSLSGLPNRAAFRARLHACLARTDRRGGHQAVLFVDLDDFKDVNDTLGHAAGDELLCVVAERLSDTMRPGDVVARLGGDEFAVLLAGLPEPALALAVAQRVVNALAAPVEIAGSWVKVGASVGLAMRHDRSTVDALMREADVAMYAAKGKGKNRVEQYDAGLDDLAVARLALKTDLSHAAERGELVLDYQPMVDLDTGLLVGLEALVRWQHPTRGLLPPSAFIEVAEETGDIIGIGAFVLDTAARQVQRWQRRYGLPELWVSVNVSVCQLDVPGFVDDVNKVLRSTRLDPASLVLEVTETILADPEGGAAAALASLRVSGVRVALDDFGSGYSSIGYLRQLPVDILKIDRSFLTGTYAGGPGHALLEAIVAMAKSLGLDVIPEGIEELDQLARLRAMGCHIGQGFLLSRPVSADAIDALLAAPMPLAHIGLWDEVIDTEAVPVEAPVPNVPRGAR